MKRTELSRRSALRSGAGPALTAKVKQVNRERKKREWARAYGSVERVIALKLLPCTVAGCWAWPSENAHVAPASAKGAGYKGSWRWCIPLCTYHHRTLDDVCGSVEVFDARYGVDLRAVAKRLAETIPKDGR